jgi:hypothetical protein
MGGNDGMKGDMRMLQDLPSLALDANASIIGAYSNSSLSN